MSRLSHAMPVISDGSGDGKIGRVCYTSRGMLACRGSVSAASPSPRSAYRYLNGRSTTAVAVSTVPDIDLRQATRPSDRAKSMLPASVGFENPRDGVAVEAGRPSRGQQSHAKKPPKPLARRLPRPKQHADTDEACGQTRVHLQPAGDRSFAPLTVAPDARSCATYANFAS